MLDEDYHGECIYTLLHVCLNVQSIGEYYLTPLRLFNPFSLVILQSPLAGVGKNRAEYTGPNIRGTELRPTRY